MTRPFGQLEETKLRQAEQLEDKGGQLVKLLAVPQKGVLASLLDEPLSGRQQDVEDVQLKEQLNDEGPLVELQNADVARQLVEGERLEKTRVEPGEQPDVDLEQHQNVQLAGIQGGQEGPPAEDQEQHHEKPPEDLKELHKVLHNQHKPPKEPVKAVQLQAQV